MSKAGEEREGKRRRKGRGRGGGGGKLKKKGGKGRGNGKGEEEGDDKGAVVASDHNTLPQGGGGNFYSLPPHPSFSFSSSVLSFPYPFFSNPLFFLTSFIEKKYIRIILVWTLMYCTCIYRIFVLIHQSIKDFVCLLIHLLTYK